MYKLIKQLIKEPTRFMATAESLLDVILVSDPSSVRKSGVINNPISDHLPVYIVLKLKSPKISPHYVAVRSYKNYDPENFTFDLASHSDSLLSVFAAPHVTSKFGIFAHGCYVISMSVEGNRMALDHSFTHSLTHSLDSD